MGRLGLYGMGFNIATARLGHVAVVKTARGGYDGKGVRVVSSAHDADDWFAS